MFHNDDDDDESILVDDGNDGDDDEEEDVTSRIQVLQDTIANKKKELHRLEQRLSHLLEKQQTKVKYSPLISEQKLTNDEILRYSRQLILPEIGVKGQLKLKHSSVLIVGCGGLGCPVALYLAGAGVGKLGLVDYDMVEVSNLHRQIGHNMETVNKLKCSSLASTCHRLNPEVKIREYPLQLNSDNALDIIAQYDVVVDGSDNVATRYLLNDACVLSRKPLVSGSVLRFEGQLTVYNYDSSTPCYRCLYPQPPNSVTNCSDGGVLGPVVGLIGTLQAIETIKILVGRPPTFAKRLLLFDGMDGLMRSVKLRNKKLDCCVCGSHPSIHQLIDYVQFCGAGPDDKDKPVSLLDPVDRITVKAYKDMLDRGVGHVLVDVREPVELEICQLPCLSVNVRMRNLGKPDTKTLILSQLEKCQSNKVVVLCRRGNDSQEAVIKLRQLLQNSFAAADVDDAHTGDDNDAGSSGDCGSSFKEDDNFPNYERACEATTPTTADSITNSSDDSIKNVNNNNNNNNNNMNKKKNSNNKNNCALDAEGAYEYYVVDIVGGLYAWKKHVDKDFPIY